MASQEDATPWAVPVFSPQEPLSPSITQNPASPDPDTLLPGRAYFSQLGIVRRKPSRGDAPPTLSKSCSDKLSLHQCTSLLSSPTSLLVSPEHAYISTLILPTSQYNALGCKRAFSDGRGEDADDNAADLKQQTQARMAPLSTKRNNWSLGGGYTFRPFTVKTTDIEFAFSRRRALTPIAPPESILSGSPSPIPKPPKIAPSNLSVARTASNREESTLNGVLQGHKASQATLKGASFASRRRIWGLSVEVASLLGDSVPSSSSFPSSSPSPPPSSSIQRIQEALGIPPPLSTEAAKPELVQAEADITKKTTYSNLKNTSLLEPRRRAKQAAKDLALKGWVRNVGDEDFALS